MMHHARDAHAIARCGCRVARSIAIQLNDGSRELQSDFLERCAAIQSSGDTRGERRELAQRWKSIAMKRGAPRSRIARKPLEQILIELKREASITLAVRMRTFEAPPEAPKQQRARRHQRRAAIAPIREGPRQHHRDRGPSVSLLEGAIARTRGTYDVEDAPSFALSHHLPDGRAGHALARLADERTGQRIASGNLRREQFLSSLQSDHVL